MLMVYSIVEKEGGNEGKKVGENHLLFTLLLSSNICLVGLPVTSTAAARESRASVVFEVQALRSDGLELEIKLMFIACTTLDKSPSPS